MNNNHLGEKHGRLTITGFIPGSHTKKRKYICLCDCGKTTLVAAYNDLVTKNTSSCGCLNSEMASNRFTTHGHTRGTWRGGRSTDTYHAWLCMKARCYQVSMDSYYLYGGRGIKVCSRWIQSFTNFLDDMGEKPKGLTLERIDVNGDYEPSNCKWASIQEQAGNKRNNIYGYWHGVRYHLAELERITDMSRPTIRKRIRLGIPLELPKFNRWTVKKKIPAA